jgi:cyclic peptide transporter
MRLLAFLREGAPEDLRRIGWMAALAGLANAGLVELISSTSEGTVGGEAVRGRFFLLYLVAFGIYYVANRAALLQANQTIENLLKELRLRVTDKIRKSELIVVENLGKGDLYTKLSSETKHLSSSFPILVNGFQQLILLFFCLLYVAYLSLPAFIAIALVTVACFMYFGKLQGEFRDDLAEVVVQEGQLVDCLGHITDGFKELRLNQKKSDAVYAHFTEVSERAEDLTVDIGERWTSVMMFTYVYVYLVMGLIVFVLPHFLGDYNEVIFKLTGATLFCIGPVVAIANLAPLATQAEVGLAQIGALEASLTADMPESHAHSPTMGKRFLGYQSIVFKGITFSYRDLDGEASFTSGPWDLELKKGELLFVVGGNGAGKSTALKLMTGLYSPDAGAIKVDGTLIERGALLSYRELYSCIFADFHLFDRLYGLEDVEPEQVNAMIDEFGLAAKVQFVNGRFSSVMLSTGQRKRLALIAALLEDRPIYVFDEPTADQDSWFRDVFFDKILVDLKKRGKTVICVTHDDRYWDRADRMVRLYLGEMSDFATQKA